MIKQHESTHIAFGVTRLQEIMQANWLSRTAFKFVFLVNCMASFPTVAGIVLAVHREHPGNFPFPLDQLKLAREGLKQLASRLRAVLFQGAKSPRSVGEL
ncbi:MAG: hypothetical protein ACK5GN_14455 [Pseudomonadota bacterium]